MERIADFRIVRELGRGAMGVVYEAIEEPLGRRVALKVLRADWAESADSAARFLVEAKSVAALRHPNIVAVHRFGSEGATAFLALEYVDGKPLDRVLATERLPVQRILDLLLDVAAGLGAAHHVGVVHRDVKPGNVLVTEEGRAVLGDFGIAKRVGGDDATLTTSGAIVGTPAYMSPEQALSRPVSPATDVYSLGVVAYELLSGRVPFTADSAISIMVQHAYESPPALDLAGVPHALAAFVHRMLAKSPAERPGDGAAVHAGLSAIRASLADASSATLADAPPLDGPTESTLEEVELTAACFELVGFSRVACEDMLPARVAFLLESWYRLVRQATKEEGGVVDRFVADKVTTLFGWPDHHVDHTARALRTAGKLQRALGDFCHAHDLHLKMRAGIATGTALCGDVVGDESRTSAQGRLLCDMGYLSKTRSVEAPIRVSRAAYRRVNQMADFVRVEDPRVGEIWTAEAVPTARAVDAVARTVAVGSSAVS